MQLNARQDGSRASAKGQSEPFSWIPGPIALIERTRGKLRMKLLLVFTGRNLLPTDTPIRLGLCRSIMFFVHPVYKRTKSRKLIAEQDLFDFIRMSVQQEKIPDTWIKTVGNLVYLFNIFTLL